MNRASIVTFPPRSLPLLVLLGALLVLAGGCVYRPTIQQGNLLKVSDVDQVTVGMTRSQVRYLLGTPMIEDPFEPQRWDYIYTLRRGRESRIDRAYFVVRFDGDRVSKVERLNIGGATDAAKANKAPATKPPAQEPPPLPSSKEPPPDAQRPGGS